MKKSDPPSHDNKNAQHAIVAEDTGSAEIAARFVRVEKNLTALGFFTPTNKGLKSVREKIVRFKRPHEGGTIETKVKIVTGGNYGLPGTADLDKYLGSCLRIYAGVK